MTPKKQPHIIFLILDSARRDMFGCYGHADGLTPNLDALASEGLLLMDHYAAGCGSSQSHVSMFLGQHPARHGMVHNLAEMNASMVALPRLLKDFGYRGFGHCMASFIPPVGYEDQFGFEELLYPGKKKAFKQRSLKLRMLDQLRKYPGLWTSLKNLYTKMMGEERKIRAYARLFDGTASLDYLFSKFQSEASSGPIFAYTTLLHPHTPYYPPKWCLEKVFKGEKIDKLSFKIQSHLHAWMNGDFGEAKSAIDSLRKCYQAELVYADYLIGEFFNKMKTAGWLENSILIVTSDHGELLGEHRLLNHGASVWEELFRVPCIIHYPKKMARGSRVSHLTSAMDLMPTLFDLLGEPDYLGTKTTLDGLSLFDSRAASAERTLVVDSPPLVLPERLKEYPNVVSRLSMISRAVRDVQYKYIWQSNGKEYLFKVGEYEDEKNDLLPAESKRALQMHDKMARFYQQIHPRYELAQYPIRMGTSAAMKMTNPTIRRELKKLGYL